MCSLLELFWECWPLASTSVSCLECVVMCCNARGKLVGVLYIKWGESLFPTQFAKHQQLQNYYNVISKGINSPLSCIVIVAN